MPLANIARYAWGVTPSLLAFPLPCLPEEPAAVILVQGLGAVRNARACASARSRSPHAAADAAPATQAFLADAAFMRVGLLPRWYFWQLRVPLTLIASASLLATATSASARGRAAAAAAAAAPPAAAAQAAAPAGRRWW
jgi:hypothetical protein